ncbi:MAG: DUF3429 domain-containing protein [Pseudomonadota bacterium]
MALNITPNYRNLTFAGTLPFIGCVLLMHFGVSELPLFGPLYNILSVYALVIATFLAGTLWGQHLHLEGDWPQKLLIWSNAITIVLWLGFLVLGFTQILMMCIVAFIALLFIDLRLFKDGILDRSYIQVRVIATIIVVAALIFGMMVPDDSIAAMEMPLSDEVMEALSAEPTDELLDEELAPSNASDASNAPE